MNPRERGFLLLTSRLGNPDRKVLTPAQLRVLAERVGRSNLPEEDRDLEPGDLVRLGYGQELAERIVGLLEEEELLSHYLRRGANADCVPITRVSPLYPAQLRRRLGLEASGCLWAKGDLSILEGRAIALVGSRDLARANGEFAAAVGRQAALQGYTLVSGNARGADRTAQEACLRAGGKVICIVADDLRKHWRRDRVLYLSEEGFDETFSAQRALSRNRCIHGWGDRTFVAQCSYQKGGTWDGSVKNLRFGWSPLTCFDDGSPAMEILGQMGAEMIGTNALSDFDKLNSDRISLFDL